MKISCIIPTLNRPEALGRTLQSLDAQQQRPDEVIVVLQGDSPPLPEEKRRFSVLALRQSEPNAQRARNSAARAASGDLLLFLDDDIEADLRLVAEYTKAFEDASLGAACGLILEPGQKPTEIIPEACFDEPLGWTKFPLNYGLETAAENFSSCNTCVRREVFAETGGFDENFVATLFDDSDWSLRLQAALKRKGRKGLHLPSARLIHFREPSGGRRIGRISRYIKTDAEGWASRLYFWRKNYGSAAWKEMLYFIRADLFCGSLLVRPAEFTRAVVEFRRGWRLASQRLASGPKLIQ